SLIKGLGPGLRVGMDRRAAYPNSCGQPHSDPPRSCRHFGDGRPLIVCSAMAGRQLNFAIKGELYEKAFDSIASGFLSIVRTPRGPDDYGIDAFCHVRFPLDAISSTVGGTFGVQVRGPGADLQFGGVAHGKWKSYEIEWLRSLAVPLYLARVSDDCL